MPDPDMEMLRREDCLRQAEAHERKAQELDAEAGHMKAMATRHRRWATRWRESAGSEEAKS